ncbi:hypothetical protein [Agromyces sp. LHK192]|uniref:hypothetical protein n=1 Tax=Agromyces sp. LHK192 TaxID=2498704 RepID=UPI000FD6D04C|nr:hypothetical protein [Agromyces sp. LHK192]
MTVSASITAPATSGPRTLRSPEGLLRASVGLDAVGGIALGTAFIVLGNGFAAELTIPAGLLLAAGWFLVPFGLALGLLATEAVLRTRLVIALVVFNVLWVAASVALLTASWAPTAPLGVALVVAQGVLIAGVTAFEVAALAALHRRSGAAARPARPRPAR